MPRRNFFSGKNLVDHPISTSALVSDEHYINLQLQQEDDDQEPTGHVDTFEYNGQEHQRDQTEQSNGDSRFIRESNIDKRQTLALYSTGFASVVIGLLFLILGILDLSWDSHLPNNSSPLQVRSKFSMLVLLLSGAAAVTAAATKRSNASVLAFSFLSAGACCCDFLMQFLSRRFVPDVLAIQTYDSVALILSLVGGAVSIAQICMALSIPCPAADASEQAEGDDHRQKKPFSIFALGAGLIIEGMAITGITLATYSELQKDTQNISAPTAGPNPLLQDVKWTLSSDLISHGWLVTAAGVSLAVTAVHMTKCRLLASLALVGGALLTTTVNCVHPLAEFYIRAWTTSRETSLSLALLLVYLLVIILTVTALIILIESIDHELISRLILRHYVEKRGWQLFKRTTVIQLCLASLYIVVWLTSFAEKYLYLLDFTPLPLLIILHSGFSYFMNSTYSSLLLLLNIVWAFLCGIYSARDIYLFDYHMAISDYDPVERMQLSIYNNTTVAFQAPKIPKGGLHLVLTAVALMELVLSVLLLLMYLKTVADTASFKTNEASRYRISVCVSSMGVAQMVIGIAVVNLGFILFLSHHFTVEYVGDSCTLLGAFILVTGLLSFLASFPKASSFATPLSALLNTVSFAVMWQHIDGEGLLMSRMTFYDQTHPDGNYHRAYLFSQATFVSLLLCQILNGLSLIGLESILSQGRIGVSGRGMADPVTDGYQLVEGHRGAMTASQDK